MYRMANWCALGCWFNAAITHRAQTGTDLCAPPHFRQSTIQWETQNVSLANESELGYQGAA
jgi:hypothetical protein